MKDSNISHAIDNSSEFPGCSSQVLTEWRHALSPDSVLDDQERRAFYGSDCGLKSVTPAAVLLPRNVEELAYIVKIAYKHSAPIHVISRGKNWGYGSACPVAPHVTLIDLSRLNRIERLDRELAYVVVEPGVTQAQLYEYLQKNAPDLCMDVTGASTESSILGNVVERGYGQTPNGDRFQNCCGMEVLLADGTLLKTGFGHFETSTSHHLYKWGIGPYLDGLFTQSNFGIVTKVGVWLMPKPAFAALMLIKMHSDAQMSKVMTKIRDLKLRRLLPATVHVSNDIRLISCFEQFPYHAANGNRSIPEDVRESLRRKLDIAPWNCFTSLRGSKAEVMTNAREIRQALRGLARVEIISSDSVRRARRFGRLYRAFSGRSLQQVEMLYSLVTGEPSDGPTLGAYWRSRRAPATSPLDPAHDACGMVWCAPVLPCTESSIQRFLAITSDSMKQFGFETNLTLTMLTDRAICATIGISFDSDLDRGRANECYETVLAQCVRSGFIPYRHGINTVQAAPYLFESEDVFWKLCRKLKEALDSRHILSPGKYGL